MAATHHVGPFWPGALRPEACPPPSQHLYYLAKAQLSQTLGMVDTCCLFIVQTRLQYHSAAKNIWAVLQSSRCVHDGDSRSCWPMLLKTEKPDDHPQVGTRCHKFFVQACKAAEGCRLAVANCWTVCTAPCSTATAAARRSSVSCLPRLFGRFQPSCKGDCFLQPPHRCISLSSPLLLH